MDAIHCFYFLELKKGIHKFEGSSSFAKRLKGKQNNAG